MGARVLYGMAKGGEAPTWFGQVHPRTQTPLRATGLVIAMVLVFALLSDLTTLAKAASAIILFVFATVNAALLKLKWSGEASPHDLFTVPFVLPLSGFIICSAMLIFALWQTFFG